ncbi:HBL329Cp [Eremothecium sinecaudum]|uniref:1,3-beta-glucanosyltransferase n=1 Tax=Eremothecium sinecaudum TaxID=45286 RepID=A0A109UVY3_9SACH|nr:HBL329Cp [Eremothecium sinecaudum]AMD18573.1 HBL329Cp [Eremothecium sinecaudum]
MVSLRSVLMLLALGSHYANAILPIEIKGRRFIKNVQVHSDSGVKLDSKVYFIKGVDYQPGGSSGYDPRSGKDLLSDRDICERDAAVFQALGINTVRIYSLNPDVNHDECMTIYNGAGISFILDVNSGEQGESLNRADPSSTYNERYLTRVFKFIEAFKEYTNVLGFFAGNEVINDQENSAWVSPQYIRAVQRDMKQYIAKHASRQIPVGYSAANIVELRGPTLDYLQCNSKDGSTIDSDLQESRSDFLGLNTYEWCSGSSDWKSSGYDKLNASVSDAVIPLLFSEVGCILHMPRIFDEISEGLFGGLINTFNGGLVYEYTKEANGYGLVEVDTEGNVKYLQDFANLREQYEKVTLPDINKDDVADTKIYKCADSEISAGYSNFGVKDFDVPDQPDEITHLIENGVNHNNIGKFVNITYNQNPSKYKVYDQQGTELNLTISYPPQNLRNAIVGGNIPEVASTTSRASSSSKNDAAAYGNKVSIGNSFFAVIASILLSFI